MSGYLCRSCGIQRFIQIESKYNLDGFFECKHIGLIHGALQTVNPAYLNARALQKLQNHAASIRSNSLRSRQLPSLSSIPTEEILRLETIAVASTLAISEEVDKSDSLLTESVIASAKKRKIDPTLEFDTFWEPVVKDMDGESPPLKQGLTNLEKIAALRDVDEGFEKFIDHPVIFRQWINQLHNSEDGVFELHRAPASRLVKRPFESQERAVLSELLGGEQIQRDVILDRLGRIDGLPGSIKIGTAAARSYVSKLLTKWRVRNRTTGEFHDIRKCPNRKGGKTDGNSPLFRLWNLEMTYKNFASIRTEILRDFGPLVDFGKHVRLANFDEVTLFKSYGMLGGYNFSPTGVADQHEKHTRSVDLSTKGCSILFACSDARMAPKTQIILPLTSFTGISYQTWERKVNVRNAIDGTADLHFSLKSRDGFADQAMYYRCICLLRDNKIKLDLIDGFRSALIILVDSSTSHSIPAYRVTELKAEGIYFCTIAGGVTGVCQPVDTMNIASLHNRIARECCHVSSLSTWENPSFWKRLSAASKEWHSTTDRNIFELNGFRLESGPCRVWKGISNLHNELSRRCPELRKKLMVNARAIQATASIIISG
jgi:hypothetical protein